MKVNSELPNGIVSYVPSKANSVLEHAMVIEVPDVGLTEQELRQELAVALFRQNRATLAKAADIAGATRLDFQRLLADRQIPVHYGLDDLAQDTQGLHEQGHA